ncbi:2900_t:CDS:2 [Diversispora eburnea]|uniref:2900_t:CDS:1 n=1 Tax=Diversispora eburnea TaxID=1213867 RepID=A0A9N9AAN3_9GLOM|nr:2900_t:CDS:2 [Diversispora eburnea]
MIQKKYLVTFFVAGHLTTGAVITIYLLAKHPQYQDKLRQELLNAFPNPEFTPTYNNLNSLMADGDTMLNGMLNGMDTLFQKDFGLDKGTTEPNLLIRSLCFGKITIKILACGDEKYCIWHETFVVCVIYTYFALEGA